MSRPAKVAIGIIIILMMACVVIWWGEPLHWLHYYHIEQSGQLRATITVLEAPRTLSPHEKSQCRLEVKNLGSTTWSKTEGFRLGGFERDWIGKRTEPPRLGPGRIEVSQDIKRGQTWVVSFDIEAAAKPGTYGLHFQMVRERDLTPGVPAPDNTWFGNETTIKIRVR
jgi:hypothetical protein